MSLMMMKQHQYHDHHNHHKHYQNQNQHRNRQTSASTNEPPLDIYLNDIELVNQRATLYLAQHGFDVTTQNGQRISVNRSADAALSRLPVEQQPQYNEIFIGKLPRDLFEHELLPHLNLVGGTIVKIRYMMDFSRCTRGFCFVKFFNTAEAARACRLLDGRVLRPNTAPIGARISFDNKCLYFGNLPPKCSAASLINALRKAEIDGIVEARMADSSSSGGGGGSSSNGNSRGNSPPFGQPSGHGYHPMAVGGGARGCPGNGGAGGQHRSAARYGHVYFESHDAATKARRTLMPGDVKILGRKITLDWAKSEIPNEISELLRNPLAASIQFAVAKRFRHPTAAGNNNNSFMMSNNYNKHNNINNITGSLPSLYEQNRRVMNKARAHHQSNSTMEPDFFTQWQNPTISSM